MLTHKNIGMLVMILAVVFFIIGFTYIYSAEAALLSNHTFGPRGECVHPEGAICPYEKLNDLAIPKYLGLFADIALFVFGLSLFLKKTSEEKVLNKAKKQAKELGGDESKVFELITQSNGMIFQNELVEKMGMTKVKITRILDKLEAKSLVERRRRGMTNVVIIKS